jgi:hypothetical protein
MVEFLIWARRHGSKRPFSYSRTSHFLFQIICLLINRLRKNAVASAAKFAQPSFPILNLTFYEEEYVFLPHCCSSCFNTAFVLPVYDRFSFFNRVSPVRYGSLAAFAVMCPATPLWQDTLADTVGTLVNK